MATDAKELERVRFIHTELDKGAAWYLKHPDYDGCFLVVTPYTALNERTEHEYTAAEMRAWPETKAAMSKLLRECRAAEWVRGSITYRPQSWGWNPETLQECGAEELARGLVMYREQLSDALSPGRALTEDGSVRLNGEQAEALKPVPIPGNPGWVSLEPRTWDADKYNGAASWIPLDQRIAAAKAELLLKKKASKRHG